MNLIKTSRKPYLSVILAIIVLFVSCEQYRLNTSQSQVFEYSILNHFKNNSTFDKVLLEFKKSEMNLKSTNWVERKNNLVDIINANYGSDFRISDSIVTLVNLNSDEILNQSLKNGWINQTDVDLTNSLITTIELEGFEKAIQTYKNDVLKLSLTDEEFLKKNAFVNILEVINHRNPDFFKTSSPQGRAIWGCIKATISVAAATVGVSACATVVLCFLALGAFAIAVDNWLDECVGTIDGN